MKILNSLAAAVFINLFFNGSSNAQCITSNAGLNNICNGNNVILTMNCPPPGGCSWDWFIGGICTGSAIGNGNSITVTPASTTTYSVKDNCAGSCYATITIKVSTLPPVGGTSPGTGTFAQYACPNTNITTTWNMDPKTVAIRVFDDYHLGLTFTAGANSGTASSGSNWEIYLPVTVPTQVLAITLPPSVNGSNDWFFRIRTENACGQSVTSPRTIHAKLPTPQVSGPVCLGCVSSATYTDGSCLCGASCATTGWQVNNETINYTWTYPTSYMTPSGGANTYSETFNNIIHPICGQQIKITQELAACPTTSLSQAKVFTVCDKPILSNITGNHYACPSDNCTLTMPAPSCGSSFTYFWWTSGGGVTVSPTNTAQVVVTTPAGFNAAATIHCQVSNGCNIQTKSFTISPYAITTPGPITGPLWGQCEQTGITYSISPIAGVYDYLWTLTPSTGVATVNGSYNLSAISIDMLTGQPAHPATLLLSVQGEYLRCNNMGTCLSAPIQVIINADPDVNTYPITISGTNSTCAGNAETFTVNYNGNGVNNFNWNTPAGWQMLGANGGLTANYLVLAQGNVNVTVTPSNNCWMGLTYPHAVSVPCRLAMEDEIYSDKVRLLSITTGKNKIYLELFSKIDFTTSLEVVDLAGKIILQNSLSIEKGNMKKEIPVADFKSGIYLLKIHNDNFSVVKKIIMTD